TALDMAKLCVHMLGLIKGSIKDGILAPALAKDMILVKTGDLKSGFTEGIGFGYGWAVVRKNNPMFPTLSLGTFGHGGAFGTQYWIDPVKDRFTILMIQRVGLSNGDASPMRVALHKAVG
ncbi:MAG: serine hydrolase, partial [Planctomycetota bacterium]